MILPFQLKLANSILTASKTSHDFAIEFLTTSTNLLYTHNLPVFIRDISVDVLSSTVLFGDHIGNIILNIYVYLVQNL